MRTFTQTLFCLLLSTSSCLLAQDSDLDRAASQLAGRIASPAGTTVAVVDFTDLQGRVTELGRFYAEELSVALVNTGKDLKVIDRAHLQTLLKELKFQSSGLIDEHTASELGRLAGVTVLITGSVTELSDVVRLTVKAMTTKTAAIQAAVAVNSPKNATTMALLRRDVGSVEAPSAASGSRATASPGVPNVRMFQNDFLIGNVESASIRRDNGRLVAHVTLSLENKSAKDEFIALRSFSGSPSALMDSLGRSWWLSNVTGLPYSGASGNTSQGYFARLAPGSRQTLILRFQAKEESRGALEPCTVSVSTELLRFRSTGGEKGSTESFTVGLSNIAVTPIESTP